MPTITVPGTPIARPRQRVGIRAGHAMTYTDGKHPVHSYKAAIRLAWAEACDHGPTTEPVTMRIEAVFPRPKGKVWKTKRMASYPNCSKPDVDNVGKAVMDALNGIAYRDDSQVWLLTVTKRVAAGDESPLTRVTISFDQKHCE